MADSMALRALFGLRPPARRVDDTGAPLDPDHEDPPHAEDTAAPAAPPAATPPAAVPPAAIPFAEAERPAPLALDCCGACKFFLADPLGPAAGRMGTADHSARPRIGDRPGNCRRHPVSVRKHDKEWCGEFFRKPVR